MTRNDAATADAGAVAETVAVEEAAVLHDLTREKRRKIPALTGIRGYAAMWVVLHHAGSLAHEHVPSLVPDNIFFARSGYLGVDLFFILSGFVLMLTYGGAFAARRPGILTDFAIGRLFRILPLHWFVLALFAAVALMLPGPWLMGTPYTVRSFLLEFLLIHTWVGESRLWNGPTWSLSTEWLAYMAFPAMTVALARIGKASSQLMVVLVAFALLIAIFLARHHPTLNAQDHLGLVRCLLEIPAGMALCRLWQLQPMNGGTGDKLLVSGALFFCLALIEERGTSFLALPAFSLMVLACATDSRVASAVFGNRLAHWLGEISFSIYLLHWLLFELVLRLTTWFAGGHPATWVAAYAGVPLLMLPLAWLTWRWIEVPGQAWGRAIVRRRRALTRPRG